MVKIAIATKDRKIKVGQLCKSNDKFQIINESMIIKKENGEPLAIFLKGVIKDPKLIEAGRKLNKFAVPTNLRKDVAGVGQIRMIRGVPFKEGKMVLSGILGYADKSNFNPCRQTALYKKHEKYFDDNILKLIKYISNQFKKHAPEQYKRQQTFIDSINPNMVLKDTVFTTLTINKNLRTRSHIDKGDFENGLGNLAVFNVGDSSNWSGGELLLPEYSLGFKIEEGDLLFFDVHEKHCNNPLKGKGRLSLVCYARKNIKFCKGLSKEQLKEAKPFKAV